VKPVCCDTSFLLALYGNDIHSQKAILHLRSLSQPITLSVLNEFELENALHFAWWRKKILHGEIMRILSRLDIDRQMGRVASPPVNLAQVVAEARRLSDKYTAKQGCRAFDLLQVATAVHLGASEFLSFDLNQRHLAKAEGLKLNS